MESTRMTKPVPTFELPNQFLVWVVQKVIVQSDFDLLLTEYYKERLKSRLKNRETHTINHIPTDYLSTELIKLTNYFPNIKSLPEKYFSFTLLSSLLFLSLSLPSIINFSISLVSFHNFSCPHLKSKCKISSRFLIITLSSIDKIESFLKQEGKKKVIPIESVSLKDSLKDPFFASISIYF